MFLRSTRLHRPSSLRVAASFLATTLLLGQSRLVLAQGSAQATELGEGTEAAVTELMRAAVARYSKNDLEGAREAFLKAWKLRQHAAIAASLAEVELKLGRYRDAAEHLSFYLAHLPTGKESSRTDAERQLAECKMHIGILQLTVDPLNATVLVDGVVVGNGNSSELFVEPGAHSLHAEKDGRRTPMQRPSVAAGETLDVRLTVPVSMPSAASSPMQVQPQTPRSEPPRIAQKRPVAEADDDGKFWTVTAGGALTAAAVGVGIMYTVQSNGADVRADELLRQVNRDSDPELVARHGACTADPPPSACSELASARDDAVRSRNIAIGSFVAGGVLGVATVGAYLFWPDEARPSMSKKLTVAPWTVGHARGLMVHGRF